MMRLPRWRAAPVCMFIMLLLACNGSDRPSAQVDIEAVVALDNEVHAAVEAADLDAVMQFWTSDAHIMPPGVPAVSGKAAVRAFFQTAFESMTLEFERSSEEVIVSGDIAVHRGSTVATYTPSGTAPIDDPQKWIDVYRRQPDGTWLIWLTIWNSDLPAAEAIFAATGGQ